MPAGETTGKSESRVADALRDGRSVQGLSQEDAAAEAGVPLRYLRILEGDLGAGTGIADELYLIPFFRRYTRFLGLRTEDLLPDFLSELETSQPVSAPQPAAIYRSPLRRLARPAAIGGAILAATLVLVRWPQDPALLHDETAGDTPSPPRFASHETAGDALAPPRSEPPAVVVGEPAPVDTPRDPAPVPEPRAGTLVDARTVAADAPEIRELRVIASEETWLALRIDDQTRTSFLLQPGETRTWFASAAFTLTIGNAGGVTVLLDGVELPPLGKSGEVVHDLRLPAGQLRTSGEG